MKTLTSYAADLKGDIESAIDAIELSIILMGPSMEDPGDGGELRRALIKKCASFGLVILPEHKELQAASESALADGHNLCRFEIQLVKKADLVVLIPKSAGSIAELGLFSARRDACAKIILLVSEEFQGQDSYLAGGPFREAQMNHAEIHFVSYSQHEEVWQIVRRRIEVERGHRTTLL